MISPLLTLAGLVARAAAYSFEFASTPTQCQNLVINLTGSGGTPPYNALIVAYGNPPGGDERRKIISHDFTGRSTSLQLAWPANAQFIAMVSDSTGIGTGGTTISVNAASSDDDSCLPTNVAPSFFFSVNDQQANVIDQCSPVRLFWTANATAPVTLYGVIPGGNSFSIDTSGATTGSDGQVGIKWTPDVAQFTDIILVAGDSRGRGSGGSTGIINIGAGDKSCLFAGAPSSTPGMPAGGSYPTSASGSSGGGGSSNVGPIVGGVIGGLAGVILVLLAVLFFLLRRRRQQKHTGVVPKPDLMDGEPMRVQPLRAGHQLEPTPFLVPPTDTSARGSLYDVSSSSQMQTSEPATSDAARPFSVVSSTTNARTSTDVYSDRGDRSDRKSGVAPPLRPVNIIQHADAGAVPPQDQEADAETVELPPAYSNIRRGQSTSQRT